MRHSEEGNKNGVGYVHFGDPANAEAAIKGLNGKDILGSIVSVRHYVKPTEKFSPKKAKSANCYVKHFAADVTEDQLRETFEKYGEVTSVKIERNPDGSSKGFGFVSFEKAESAEKAILQLNGTSLFGMRPLYVSIAQKKAERLEQLLEQFTSMSVASPTNGAGLQNPTGNTAWAAPSPDRQETISEQLRFNAAKTPIELAQPTQQQQYDSKILASLKLPILDPNAPPAERVSTQVSTERRADPENVLENIIEQPSTASLQVPPEMVSPNIELPDELKLNSILTGNSMLIMASEDINALPPSEAYQIEKTTHDGDPQQLPPTVQPDVFNASQIQVLREVLEIKIRAIDPANYQRIAAMLISQEHSNLYHLLLSEEYFHLTVSGLSLYSHYTDIFVL